MSGPARTDLASLADRLALLQVTRLAMAGMTMVAGVTLHRRFSASTATIDALAVLYAAATTWVELWRRQQRVRGLRSMAALLAVDGLYVAWANAVAGGPRGPLGFLVFLHVLAVTMLLSYRTGLKVALWHVGLLYGASWAAGVGLAGRSTSIPPDAAALQAVAVLLVAAAAAAFNALNERELRRGRAEMAALAALSARLQETRRVGEIRAAVVEEVVEALGFRRAALVLGTVSDELGEQAAESREPVLRARVDAVANPKIAAHLPGASNVVVLPLVADGEVAGTLILEHGGRPGARLAGRKIAVAAQFAAHAALALRNAVLLAEVEKLATTDMLTGLVNRRVFEDEFGRALALSRRTGEPCSLAVVDVDHFKSVNDVHGHQTGDEVLRALGGVLAATARTSDVAARFGGEEFVFVLPATDTEGAVALAERLRAAVGGCDTPVPFTVSVGVATFPAHAADGHGLLAAADAALYQSKHDGRDRVTVAGTGRPARVAG